MAIGTAGYTAMLAVLALEKHGLDTSERPGGRDRAAGGVGSVAIALLAKAGWHVIASTGRAGERLPERPRRGRDHRPQRVDQPAKPLAKERWAAGSSGRSHTLANLLAMTKYRGARRGLRAGWGMDLPTVAPFILRGVSLLGIDSVMAPKALRLEAWRRLAADLDHGKLAAMTRTIPLDQVIEVGRDILDGKVLRRAAWLSRSVDGLGRVDGFENDQAECECDERPEVPVGLLAAERDALEALELSHELLDAGARPVERLGKKAGRSLAEDFTGMTGQMPRLRAAARLALAS